MKRIKAFLTASALTCTALLSAAWYAPDTAAAGKINIMPIGDSITFGYGEDGGYRKYLDRTLKTMNIDFDMVGPEGKNNDSFRYNGQTLSYDGNHAGYSGFTIKQQYPVPSWGENGLLERLRKKDAVKTARPDIVLLIIGTNDMTANRDLKACEQELHTLLDYILGDMPEDGVIFLGSIPEFTAYGGNAQRVGNYNNTVKKVAESYGERVRFADVHGCLNGMADMADDKLHPSGAGYEKMGNFWAQVIGDYLEENASGNDPDDPMILHTDFENGLSGWTARGGCTVAAANDTAAEGTGSASVTNRTADWNGIAHAISTRRCPAGTHLRTSAQILHHSDSPVHFKMTLQYESGGQTVYDTFAEADAAPGEWAVVSCADYVMPDGSSPVLYVETDGALCDFRLDEVQVIKTDGTVPPSEDPTPEPTTAPATEPTTEPPQDPAGDLDGDGACTVADAVLLQKYLLAVPGAELKRPEAADLLPDGMIDVFDLGLLRRRLIRV